jgi:hypothetical protein
MAMRRQGFVLKLLSEKKEMHIRNASLGKKKDLEEEIERKQREIIVELCLLNINERSRAPYIQNYKERLQDTILTN